MLGPNEVLVKVRSAWADLVGDGSHLETTNDSALIQALRTCWKKYEELGRTHAPRSSLLQKLDDHAEVISAMTISISATSAATGCTPHTHDVGYAAACCARCRSFSEG